MVVGFPREHRYEMFKKHTKEELRHRWDLMLEGKESSVSGNFNFSLHSLLYQLVQLQHNICKWCLNSSFLLEVRLNENVFVSLR